MPTPPSPDDPLTVEFVQRIRSNPEVRMRAALQLPNYPDNLKIILIEKQPTEGAIALKCWFNCINEAFAGRGEVVYGWAIWIDKIKGGEIRYLAQHHAVLRTPSGLVDITPHEDGTAATAKQSILFVPDQRVPFDHEKGAAPPAFIWDIHLDENYWAIREEPHAPWIQLPGYGVMKFKDENWWKPLPSALQPKLIYPPAMPEV